ncbi:MAG: hypothetical protein MUP70_16165, partial [Candidatus Aminicenantes bacterium]|nr:hypothetical protein [Candidatus Aminicenantes bacterium]
MRLREIAQHIQTIRIPVDGVPVEETAAIELQKWAGISAEIVRSSNTAGNVGSQSACLAVDRPEFRPFLEKIGIRLPEREWVLCRIEDNGSFRLLSSSPSFLFGGLLFILDRWADKSVKPGEILLLPVSFDMEKATFDLFLTQYARTMRGFNRESYIREYARLGFTHIEVNGLATPFPCESGVAGEFYPDFYTYCPGLDQFVSSRLNRGIYSAEYLQANLKRLKKDARSAVRYGLTPGLLCFEPRSVPEELLHRYPTLRGARVDHPFRSFKPRYNLSIVHPVVQAHYGELMENLMSEVPELGFLTVWTNDSGAGFEHTKSLYVGRNGGAYLIREWRQDEDIARSAAGNALNFFRLLRDSASRYRSDFRVITRLEPFYGERRFLWPGFGERLDVEGNSLLAEGWESPYVHSRYADIPVLGSALHNSLKEEERAPLEDLRSRGGEAYFYHFFGSHGNHEPLLGIPFPWLVYDKLRSAFALGARALAHLGGIHPPLQVAFAVNQELFRRFQFDADMDVEGTVLDIAESYAGRDWGEKLRDVWRIVDDAVQASAPLSIYTHYGVVWQRLFVRPLVPDIDRIPEEDRAYYERFMCTSVHNPNRVDLAQDVLFRLLTKEYAGTARERMDEQVIPLLKEALEQLTGLKNGAKDKDMTSVPSVFCDLEVRTRALRCLIETLRNTAAWVESVHSFLDTLDKGERASCRRQIEELMDREIQNSRDLMDLCNDAGVEWMIVAENGETPFLYGDNMSELLARRIGLMERHRGD